MAQTKTIDITPARIKLPVIEVSQFDIGRPIIIHMKDGDDWYDLTGLTVKLQGTKPSGFGYSVTGVVSGHDVTFTTTYDMTSEAGFILSEVSIIDGESPIGSQNAMLHVEKSPHPPEIVDGSPETVLPEMRELVNRAEAAAEILLDCSAVATTLPTGASATASYSPETGVFSFGLPRGAKGDTGDTGETGNGISNIRKTSTSGLVDTYTITYTDGTTTTFTVTNGRNGSGSVADVTQNGVSVLDGNVAKVTVPTATSDLTNDSNFVADSSYVHTDNNFTTTLKNKLNGIASGAEVNVQSDWNQTTTTADDYIKNKPTIPTVPTNVSAFTNDAGYITGYTETDPVFVASPAHGITSANISSWNGKATASGITVTLAVADWANSTQTVTATGVTASNNVIVSPAPASVTDYVAAGIVCTAQGSNSLTFTCTTTPTSAINVNVIILS